MARTTGRSGFKMKSGNTSTFKMMGSSPMREGEGDKKETFTGKSEKYGFEREINPDSKFDKSYYGSLDSKARADEYLNSKEYAAKLKEGIEKFGSKQAYQDHILETAGDRNKPGGIGATDYNTSVEVDFYKMKDRNREVNNLSKKELMKDAGKKTNVINRLFTNKQKLKNKAVAQNFSEYYDTKGSGSGQQALQHGDVSDIDKYSGVTKDE